MASASFAQLDEIVVTATRVEENPSLYYTRKGDNLLLQVDIESDAREYKERLEELNAVIKEFVVAAKSEPDISLSFIGNGNSVRPLRPSLYEEAIGSGGRPDTSVARIQVKTAIPDEVPDAFELSKKLLRFVEDFEETGRISITTDEEVTISVINPEQYRKYAIKVITDEVNAVTQALGPEYRVILGGLNQPMKSYRSGDLNLSFYLPYSYVVIPNTLHSYRVD